MNILVTGGCGYVGSVLVPKLLQLGHQVTVVDTQWFGNFLQPHPKLELLKLDIRDTDKIPMKDVDAIIHLANIANDPCSEIDPRLSWEVNVLASMQIAERAIANKVKSIIYSSSGSVYGVKDEDQVTEDLSLVPISDYNKTKMISERVFLSYKEEILIQCVRPATVCGPSPRMRLDLSVNMLTMQALKNKKITVFGGQQTRPNIHVQDLTDVFIHLLNQGEKAPGIFNAGFENAAILGIAEAVSKHIPAEITVSESNDPRSYRLNSDKILKTGFVPKYKFEDAISGLAEQFEAGLLVDKDESYNLKVMKALSLY